jgi:hypothetical protein
MSRGMDLKEGSAGLRTEREGSSVQGRGRDGLAGIRRENGSVGWGIGWGWGSKRII